MEFLSGYAAAKAPYLTYEVEGAAHSHSSSRSKPARTHSTSGTKKKRSRIPGHARTNSASTSSSGGRSDPQQQQQQQQQQQESHPHPGQLWVPPSSSSSSGGGGTDAAAAAAAAAVAVAVGVDTDVIPLALTLSAGDGPEHNHALRRSSHRERMPAGFKYFQDKQLPATPRLNTHDIASKHPAGTGSTNSAHPASASASARTPQHDGAMFVYTEAGAAKSHSGARAESVSSVSGATTTSNRTVQSGEPGSDSHHPQRPFMIRNGRTYLADPTLPYPLPVDLEELHRQSLKTMLLMQLYGRPICAPAFANKPPARILEIGCGTGFWSMMCYKYYEARGYRDVAFTGVDIVPLPPNSSSSSTSPSTSTADVSADTRPDKDMSWRFVQHDLRKLPLPVPDAGFDFIMVKDMSLVASLAMQQTLIEEYIRKLTPGGTLEIWETDHLLRMLRPHVPDYATTSGPCAEPDTTTPADHPADETPETTPSENLLGGAYVMTPNTPLSTPLNNFLVEYNGWASRALDARSLCAMPCTAIGPLLLQEAENLTGLGSRRLAVPLSEIRWEREGVGGVVTKDGKSYIDTTKSNASSRAAAVGGAGAPSKEGGGGAGGKGLEAAAAALRRTALLTVVQQIQSLEPMLREAGGKSQDEWDTWVGKMMNDLVRENGTSWGECLEVGAWWARKR